MPSCKLLLLSKSERARGVAAGDADGKRYKSIYSRASGLVQFRANCLNFTNHLLGTLPSLIYTYTYIQCFISFATPLHLFSARSECTSRALQFVIVRCFWIKYKKIYLTGITLWLFIHPAYIDTKKNRETTILFISGEQPTTIQYNMYFSTTSSRHCTHTWRVIKGKNSKKDAPQF